MTPPLVFLDTETTSLAFDREPWEIAVIRRHNGVEDVGHWFLEVDLATADPTSLEIGQFYVRHPAYVSSEHKATPRFQVAQEVMMMTAGAHVVGANPAFDTYVLDRLLRGFGLAGCWHYHLIDVTVMAYGWLACRGAAPMLPYRTDALAERLGIGPVPGRHTALGDARFVQELYDRMVP